MKIEVRKFINPIEWDRIVCMLDGNIKHCYAWAEYQKQIGNGEPVFVFTYDDNCNCIGASLAFVTQSRYWPISLLNKTLRIDTLPLVKENSRVILYEMLIEIEKYARANDFVLVEIGSSNANVSFNELIDLNFKIEHRIEFCIDLSCSIEEIWERFSKSLRANIKKAMKSNITVSIGKNKDDISVLRKMQMHSSQRQSNKGNIFSISDENIYDNIKKYMIDTSAANLFIARQNNEDLASYLCSTFNNKHTGIFSGSSKAGKKLSAPSLILWETMNIYKKKGFKKFVLGGLPEASRNEDHSQHGVYEFKNSFGARQEDRYGGYKVLSEGKYKLYRLLKTIRK